MIKRILLLAGLAFAFGSLTGAPALAASAEDCLSNAVAIAGHYDGDGDQRSDGADKEVAHHHAPCAGHSMAIDVAPADTRSAMAPFSFEQPALDVGVPQSPRTGELRPPIA